MWRFWRAFEVKLHCIIDFGQLWTKVLTKAPTYACITKSYLILNFQYNFFRDKCFNFLGNRRASKAGVLARPMPNCFFLPPNLSPALSFLARSACPPVIKLIIPGERLTRYGSQRITIDCKKPIIRTLAQITNSASPPPTI